MFRYLNLAIKKDLNTLAHCYACNTVIEDSNIINQQADLIYDLNNLKEEPSLKDQTCNNCKTKLLLNVEVNTPIESTSLTLKIDPVNTSEIQKKLDYLLQMYTLYLKDAFIVYKNYAGPEGRHLFTEVPFPNKIAAKSELYSTIDSALYSEWTSIKVENNNLIYNYPNEKRIQDIQLLSLMRSFKVMPDKLPLVISENLNFEQLINDKSYVYLNSFEEDTITLEEIDADYYKQFENFFFVDVDGTLISEKNNKKSINIELLDYLKELEETKKAKIIFCSGRPESALFFACKDFGIKYLAIGDNGHTIIFRALKNKYIRDRMPEFTNPLITKNLKALFSQVRICHEREYLKQNIDILYENLRIAHGMPFTTFITSYDRSFVSPWSVEKITEEVEKLAAENPKIKSMIEFIGGVTFTPGGNGTIHMHSSLISKGSAAKKLIEALEIPIENTMHIGNSWNDISMAKNVGFLCCVGDGEPEYKSIVDYVATKDSPEGIKQCIDLFFSKK